MLTNRDKQILKFIEDNRAISIQQANNIFFKNYKSCSRRMKQLEDLKIIKSYKNLYNNQKVFYTEKKISEHDLFILDFYSWIYANDGEVLEFKKEPRYFSNNLRPDALFKFKIPYCGEEYTVFALLEVDYTHYKEISDLKLYEKLFKDEVLKDYCGPAEFPFVIVARERPGLKYNSADVNYLYTSLDYKDLGKLIFS